MKFRYGIAALLLFAALTLRDTDDALVVFTAVRIPYQRDWIYLIAGAVLALLIALSFRLSNPSLRWLRVTAVSVAWYITSFCTLNFMKAGYRGPIAPGLDFAQSLLSQLTGQFRLEYFTLPLALPTALLLTGLLLRGVSTRVSLWYVALLLLGGLAIDWGMAAFAGQLAPDTEFRGRAVVEMTPQIRLGIVAARAALITLWVYGVLAVAGWGSRADCADPAPPVRSLSSILLRPTELGRYFFKLDDLHPPAAMIIGGVAELSIIVYFVTDQSWIVSHVFRALIFFAPPILAALLGIQTAQHYGHTEALQLVSLSPVEPIDISVALLQTALYRMRWIMLACLGVLIALCVSQHFAFRDVYTLQMGMPLISVVVAWLGVIAFSAALGVAAALHFKSKIAVALTPLLALAAALIVLPLALGELGPKGWLTTVAGLLVFSSLPWFGLHEFLRIEAGRVSA